MFYYPALIFDWLRVLIPLAVLVRMAVAVTRFARLPRGSRSHYWRARLLRLRWRHLVTSLGLTWGDGYVRAVNPIPASTSVRVGKPVRGRQRVCYPRARCSADAYSVTAAVRTIPRVGAAEFEKVADHLAHATRAVRVSVTSPRPGRLAVKCFLRDPLLEQLGFADMPATDLACPYRVWLGRDEHGADRWLDLRNVSGVCVGGQPGGGKSQAITSWETQLAPSPAVQFANVDGKGAGEFDDFTPRAWVTAGDSMDRFLATLESLTGLMYDRLRVVREFTGGKKNIWTVGVSPAWPLQFSVFDETQSFFDMAIAKALGKDREKACAQAIHLGSDLVRKGRSVGMCSVFATQKPTTDSLPSAISSNCALSVAFSLKTLDGAKSVLGQDVGNYPSLSPVTLSLPEHAGVCVTTLRDGQNPFSMLRSPLVTEDQAAKVAADSAQLRQDPRTMLPKPKLELVKAS